MISYKGHDLDLRPVSAGLSGEEVGREPARTGDPGAGRDRARREPVAVALIVLDCCNAAFEIARVHGAREVRLEHLLHALTRVPTASAMLEELGIRVDQLRRQTAVAIAAEPPGASADAGGGVPVASAPFEALLRRAAGEAGKRQSAATLQDILRALLDSPVAMLLRQATDPQRLAGWRKDASRQPLSAVAPLPDDRTGAPATSTPEAATGRLGALETAFHSLQAGFASDRTTMSDVLRDLRAELAALRASRASPGDAAPGAVPDGAIEAKLGDLGRAMALLAERLTALDRQLAGAPWEEMRVRLEAVEGRLREETERHWAGAEERQQALEASVHAQIERADEGRKGYHDVLGAIYDALLKLGTNQDELGKHFTMWRTETSGDLGIISSRVDQLDHAALDMLGQLSEDLNTLQRNKSPEGMRRLRENLRRWLDGTRGMLTTDWRKRLPTLRPSEPRDPAPPTPAAILAREPDEAPAEKSAEKPGRPDEPAKPS